MYILMFEDCILNPGHGKIPDPGFQFIYKDKYPI